MGRPGAASPGDWLSWKLGVAPSTAREQVRVAVRLRTLPKVAARFSAGTLSYSKVRAVTRTALSDDEDLLLEWADHATAAQLETVAAATRRAQRRATEEIQPDEDPAQRWRMRTHHDGTATISITAPVEDLAALDGQAERLAVALVRDREQTDDGAPSPQVRAVDRIEALCHAVTAATAADTPADTSGLDTHTLVLQVEADAVGSGASSQVPADVVPVRDLHRRITAMDRRVLRRLACDAGVVLAVTHDGTVMDIGRRRRALTAALRRAVHLRDRRSTTPRR